VHAEAYAFVASVATVLVGVKTAVEIGSRDINGSVRELFPGTAYTGLDLIPGPGVNVVADASTWRPLARVDLVVCCEVLEHARAAALLVENMIAMLAPGGHLIVTCAMPPRPPHSGIDGNRLRPSEWYLNVRPGELHDWVDGMAIQRLETHKQRGDLYLWATKPGGGT
jgi:SAM-dependent methyltransferase